MPNRGGKSPGKILPVVIWLGAVAAVATLYVQRTKTFSVTGLAVSRVQTVSAADDGVIRHLPVTLYETVRQGDVVAVMEAGSPLQNDYQRAALAAKKASAQAELERLESELTATKEKMELEQGMQSADQTLQRRQLMLDAERARLEILRIQTSLEPDRVLLSGLEMEKEVLEQLLEKEAIEPYEVQKIRLQCEQLRRKVEAQVQLLAQAETDQQEAEIRLASFPLAELRQDRLGALLEPLRKAMVVQEKRLAELFSPMTKLTMTAPFDGIVSAMYCTQGQAVTVGQTLLTLSQPSADSVMVWLDQRQNGVLAESMPVEVIKIGVSHKILRCQVVSVGSVIEQMPQQLWKNPSVPQWGRPARIAIPANAGLLGNEIVGVRGL